MDFINLLMSLAQENWLSIVLIMAFTVLCGILLKWKRKDLVFSMILDLVVKAEKNLGSGSGALKKNEVITALYAKLPFIVRFLFSQAEIEQMIEQAVNKLKAYLSDGITLTSLERELDNAKVNVSRNVEYKQTSEPPDGK